MDSGTSERWSAPSGGKAESVLQNVTFLSHFDSIHRLYRLILTNLSAFVTPNRHLRLIFTTWNVRSLMRWGCTPNPLLRPSLCPTGRSNGPRKTLARHVLP